MPISTTQINKDYSVTKQLAISEISEVSPLGFRSLINNRPEGEEEGQPAQNDIRKAAEAAGLHYAYLPVKMSGFDHDTVKKMCKLLEDLPKPVLGFCRSGGRSAKLYDAAMAEMAALETMQAPSGKWRNVGSPDRLTRLVVGGGLIAAIWFGPVGEWGWLGLIPLITGAIGSCPLYGLFGVNTCEIRKG